MISRMSSDSAISIAETSSIFFIFASAPYVSSTRTIGKDYYATAMCIGVFRTESFALGEAPYRISIFMLLMFFASTAKCRAVA